VLKLKENFAEATSGHYVVDDHYASSSWVNRQGHLIPLGVMINGAYLMDHR